MISAPFCASRAAASASSAPMAMDWLPSARAPTSLRSSPSARMTVWLFSASAAAPSAADLISAATDLTSSWICAARFCASRALFSDVSASARTSSATTAKPRPWSPARAASMAALSARRLVWSETWPTVLVTSPMLAACWLSCSMMATEAACRSPLCLMLFGPGADLVRAFREQACSASVRRRAGRPVRAPARASRPWCWRRRAFLARRWQPPRRRWRSAPSPAAVLRPPMRLR